MNCYNALARWYDSLTGDVPYCAFADYYEGIFAADGGGFDLLLDLCCGTGTLTWEMARRGYEMIAADRSAEMLTEAQSKSTETDVPPLFLCQAAEKLDLYGTRTRLSVRLTGSTTWNRGVCRRSSTGCISSSARMAC